MSGFPQSVRRLIRVRAGDRCERCTAFNAVDVHHRRPRGAGGSRDPITNTAVNGVLICRRCHSWVESFRAGALADGWLVRQGQDPGLVPVLYHGTRWVLLDGDGGMHDHGGVASARR